MLMLPIMINDVAGAPSAVKWMYAIEACLSLTLLYPIARWSEKHLSLIHICSKTCRVIDRMTRLAEILDQMSAVLNDLKTVMDQEQQHLSMGQINGRDVYKRQALLRSCRGSLRDSSPPSQ